MRAWTAQLSLLSLRHLVGSLPDSGHFGSNRGKQHRQLVRQRDKDARRDFCPGIMVRTCYTRHSCIFVSIKENKWEVGGCQEFFSGAAKNHEEKKIQQEDSRAGAAGWGRSRTAASGLNEWMSQAASRSIGLSRGFPFCRPLLPRLHTRWQKPGLQFARPKAAAPHVPCDNLLC